MNHRIERVFAELSKEFADQIAQAVRARIEELLDEVEVVLPAKSRITRGRARKHAGEKITPSSSLDASAALVAVLKVHPNGLRAEDLRAALGLTRAKMSTVVAAALAAEVIRKTGARRGTIYFAT